jgi:MYXO-CTERM domain-containing protein
MPTLKSLWPAGLLAAALVITPSAPVLAQETGTATAQNDVDDDVDDDDDDVDDDDDGDEGLWGLLGLLGLIGLAGLRRRDRHHDVHTTHTHTGTNAGTPRI